MAEGVLRGLRGGEGDGAEAVDAEARRTAEAYAAALAADHAKYDPAVARATETFLQEQALLLKEQREDLAEQRPLRLSVLRRQRFGQGIRIGMQVLTALFLSAFSLGLIWLVIDAAASCSVVVAQFNAPQELAAQGVTGEVVAGGVQDALQQLASATRSVTQSLSVQNAWSSDVKIEVPETGVSVGDISRLLHERFGHDLHISGDLIEMPSDNLAITIRGDGVPSKTFTGAPADLERLTTQAAEYAYGRSQPLQLADYLVDNNRNAEALGFIPGAFARVTSAKDRAVLALDWGVAFDSLGQHAQAAEKNRLAIQLNPKYWTPRANLVVETAFVSGEEAAWRTSREFLRLAHQGPPQDRPGLRLFAYPAQVTWDLPLLRDAWLADAAVNGGAGTTSQIVSPSIADTYALMHDPAHAALYMAASDPDDTFTKTEAALLAGYAALDRGDPDAAVAPLNTFWVTWLKDTTINVIYFDNGCLLGLAYGLIGRQVEAETVFKRIGPWSRCYAARGDMLEHLGDLQGAERAWADGLRVSPDLPFVYLARGLSEEKRGDVKAAEADLSAASARARHFADPLKAWADLLARENRWPESLAKYEEALKYAPAWAELHQARDAAAQHRS